MTVLILHGITGRAGVYWQQWLHDELVKRGTSVIMPRFPSPDRPDRYACLQTIKKLLRGENHKELVIVGHSLGVASALDYIEQADAPIKALISVSGFSEDYGAELNSYFMAAKKINLEKVNDNLFNAFVLYGDDDPYVPQKTLQNLAEGLGVKPKVYSKGGHLNARSGFTQFEDLLEIVKGLI